MRGVVYDERRGGYIDNVPATFTRSNNDVGIHYANYPAPASGVCPNGQPSNITGYCVPPGAPAINNYNIAASAINPVTYKGIRAEALYKFSDDWDLLITQSYQDLESQGVFYQQPNGSDGAAAAAAAGDAVQQQLQQGPLREHRLDGERQVRGPEGRVYRRLPDVATSTRWATTPITHAASTPTTISAMAHRLRCDPDADLFLPERHLARTERNEHQQHEFRLSTPDDWRLRAIAGAYWEDNKLYDETDWRYKSVPPCTAATRPPEQLPAA